jgi:hypothetical protein
MYKISASLPNQQDIATTNTTYLTLKSKNKKNIVLRKKITRFKQPCVIVRIDGFCMFEFIMMFFLFVRLFKNCFIVLISMYDVY